MKNKKYKLLFIFAQPTNKDGEWKTNYRYKLINTETGEVISDVTTTYTPRARIPDDMNEWRTAIAYAARMRVREEHKIFNDMSIVCLNKKSDFLTKGEKSKKTRASKRVAALAAPQTESVQQDCCYYVVQDNGVWTIKKSASQLLTEDEAKTLLFQKIVNGED